MTNDNYQFTKSFEKTLETLHEIFGSNDQDLIDSVLQILHDEQKQKEKQEEK